MDEQTTATEQTQEPQGEAVKPQGTDWKAEARKWESRAKASNAEVEQYKAKAAKFDEIEEAKKTELEKANEKAASLEEELKQVKASQAHTLLVSRIAEETGIPAKLLHGETEEELKASADLVSEFVATKAPNYPTDKGGAVQGGAKTLTQAQIAQIKDPMAQLKAIRENKEAFQQ